jgi:hypothetical protein
MDNMNTLMETIEGYRFGFCDIEKEHAVGGAA